MLQAVAYRNSYEIRMGLRLYSPIKWSVTVIPKGKRPLCFLYDRY
jgi:hypothetical protein